MKNIETIFRTDEEWHLAQKNMSIQNRSLNPQKPDRPIKESVIKTDRFKNRTLEPTDSISR
jgi:hypothetical protein